MQEERNCQGAEGHTPVAAIDDGLGPLVFTKCPKAALPPGFGGYRDRGTYVEMYSACKEFGWTPEQYLEQDPDLLSIIMLISTARNKAEAAYLGKPAKTGEETSGRFTPPGKAKKKKTRRD